MSDNPKNASFAYDALVKDEDDFLGQLAYCVYKRQKIYEIKRRCAEENVLWLPDEEIADFVRLAQTPQQMELYKEKAERLVNAFLEASIATELDEKKHKLERSFLNTYKSSGFMYGVGQSLLATVLFTAIGMFLYYSGIWDFLLRSAMKVK